MEKMSYKDSIDALKASTMFHMSLGSKELFHSNFLHWISIVNWDAFLNIMHGLADTKEFWWEQKFSPEKNNLEVRREYHNFDLSIYLLDSEKVKEAISQIDDKDDEDDEIYNLDNEGVRKVQKWIPVLILENKMKSLPYDEQLENYTLQAFSEWRKGELVSSCIKELKGKETTTILKKKGITFILLSLMQAEDIMHEVTIKYSYYKNDYSFSFGWVHKTYSDLLSLLSEKVQFNKELDKLVLNDYCGFLRAMINLGQCWIVNPDESFRCQIYPWKINTPSANNRAREIEEYKKLRIHDIHEKLMYCHLLSMLEKKLSDKFKDNGIGPMRYDTRVNKQRYKDGCRLFTKSDYAHGVGIFEVQYFVFPFERQDKGKEEFFKLILQVQGNRYCHMLICNDIVEESSVEGSEKNKKTISVNVKNLEKYWKSYGVSIEQSLGNYISINGQPPSFFNLTPEKGRYGQYGKNNIYQYVDIPENATVNAVINGMVNDIEAIYKWASNVIPSITENERDNREGAPKR